MGRIASTLRGAPTSPAPRAMDKETYLAKHPGLHNPTVERIVSEASTNVTYAPPPSDSLSIQSVDLDVQANTLAHHTDEYDITRGSANGKTDILVVRRGQTFDVVIHFNRKYDVKNDDLRLVFQYGNRPARGRGTHVEFILSEEDLPDRWGAYTTSEDSNSIRVAITTPPTCLAGKWSFSLDVVRRDNNRISVHRWKLPDPIYMLLNPWCKDDFVYMHDEEQLKEYVLNDTGKIYSGTMQKITAKPWVYGQFSGDILDWCLYILEASGLPDRAMGKPVVLVRKISSMINAENDNGVLEGNWTGVYTGGTPPLDWTGSAVILEEYYKKKTPVKYGQCWVFSGLVTTVCRALGIPTRCVTNFGSAHDTDASMTVDVHFDTFGKPMREYDSDSIWNFHVWNDVWMARPDLPPGFGGWQAIDATPQETSFGVYAMGPVSLMAIKRGEVEFPFDTPFAFAEVNADKVYWQMQEDNSFKVARIVKRGIGRFISTRKPGVPVSAEDDDDDERDDITDLYKFQENTEEERAAVFRANLHSSKVGVYEIKEQDVVFELLLNPDTFIGDDIGVGLKMKNTSTSSRTVNATLTVGTMYYTGVHFCDVADKSCDDTTLKPGEESIFAMKIEPSVYLSKLTDHCICKVSCMSVVKETKQTFADIEELRLRKPHLTIKAPHMAKVGETVSVEVSFVNPLHVALTSGELRVEAPGIQAPVVFKQSNIGAKQTFTSSFNLTPARAGMRRIVVYYNSAQLAAVTGEKKINITA